MIAPSTSVRKCHSVIFFLNKSKIKLTLRYILIIKACEVITINKKQLIRQYVFPLFFSYTLQSTWIIRNNIFWSKSIFLCGKVFSTDNYLIAIWFMNIHRDSNDGRRVWECGSRIHLRVQVYYPTPLASITTRDSAYATSTHPEKCQFVLH